MYQLHLFFTKDYRRFRMCQLCINSSERISRIFQKQGESMIDTYNEKSAHVKTL